MEEKKTIFNYISQVFTTFGIIVLIFILLSILIGERTEDYSTLFAMGNEGLSIATLCELLLLAVMITLARLVFLTDRWIMNMTMIARNALFFLAVLIMIVFMVFAFKWFPVDDLSAWIGFILSYALSMVISVFVTKLKERSENSKMQEALDQYNERTGPKI